MLQKILVPLDGSPLAEAVLPEIRRFFRHEDSEVILLRVSQAASLEPYGLGLEAALAEARLYVARLARDLVVQGIRARSVAELGTPAGTVLRVAREEKATLIAMATHGRTGFRRAVVGSVAEAVLRASEIPVFVVRPEGGPVAAGEPAVAKATAGEPPPLRNILVPLDGSERALTALRPAADLARRFRARVVLLHVVVPERETGVPSPEEPLKKAASRLRRRGISTLNLIENGDPAQTILDSCHHHEVDLIVMATHGRTGLARVVTGSVTEAVLRQAPVPLLVVRPADAAAERGVA